MGQPRCTCGHVISDVSAQLPYVGDIYILRQQGDVQFWDEMSQGMAVFSAALAQGRRDEWIRERFGDQYPRDLPDRDVLHDFIVGLLADHCLGIYQCENCGRLWVQENAFSSHYRPFKPEGEWRDTLAVIKTRSPDAEAT